MHSISCGMKRWYRAAMQVRAAISCLTAATTISRGPWVLLRLHTYTLTGLAIVRQGGPSSFEAPCRESLRLGQAQWNENEIAPGVWGSCSNTCWSSKWERVHLLWNLSELKVSDQKKVGFWEFSDCSPDIYLSLLLEYKIISGQGAFRASNQITWKYFEICTLWLMQWQVYSFSCQTWERTSRRDPNQHVDYGHHHHRAHSSGIKVTHSSS